jgi:hypothetical protein
MLKRQLQKHQAVIVAARDIEATQELDSGGVGLEQLARHPLTRDITGEESCI